MTNDNMPHPGHDKHLCYLINLRYQESNPEDYKALIKNPQFFCRNCGRAAADSKNLCKPVKL
ncbi:MAG: hypothetical protein OEV87_09370 [Phycisphaerae bacterium]|nr:hypothetical protein [Phycisphaerae bacterium]